MDLLYIGLIVLFFAVSAAVIAGCEKLRRPQ
ncbi:MAG TPA: potassium ABC transporter ATPase [Burkholderiales bacterium]|nr:potassium ABC transporter ATPase [Burkholderiales bacterium]